MDLQHTEESTSDRRGVERAHERQAAERADDTGSSGDGSAQRIPDSRTLDADRSTMKRDPLLEIARGIGVGLVAGALVGTGIVVFVREMTS